MPAAQLDELMGGCLGPTEIMEAVTVAAAIGIRDVVTTDTNRRNG